MCVFHNRAPIFVSEWNISGPINHRILRDLKPIAELQHNEVVCAITIAPENSKVYTGGQGCIKVWDISRPKESTRVELSKIDCQIGENYVRSCKLLPDNNMLLVGGESNFVSIIDLTVS